MPSEYKEHILLSHYRVVRSPLYFVAFDVNTLCILPLFTIAEV